jgi:thioredoxin reductase (NADPH)
VVLATGVADRQPVIGGKLETVFPYANKGMVCYCEICDGHLTKGKDVAVIGSDKKAALTALDILYFNAKSVSILTHGKGLFEGQKISARDRRDLLSRLSSKNVTVFTEEIASLFGVQENFLGVKLLGGRELKFDISFSALGIYRINNDLAVMLGGATDEEGYVQVDDDCRILDGKRKPIPGFYAVGDVNQNWNQLMAGFGDADRAVIHAWSAYL